jgi:hypothetical protein
VPSKYKAEAEQAAIVNAGGAKSTNQNTPLRNVINAISPKKPDYAARVEKGQAVLKAAQAASKAPPSKAAPAKASAAKKKK